MQLHDPRQNMPETVWIAAPLLGMKPLALVDEEWTSPGANLQPARVHFHVIRSTRWMLKASPFSILSALRKRESHTARETRLRGLRPHPCPPASCHRLSPIAAAPALAIALAQHVHVGILVHDHLGLSFRLRCGAMPCPDRCSLCLQLRSVKERVRACSPMFSCHRSLGSSLKGFSSCSSFHRQRQSCVLGSV